MPEPSNWKTPIDSPRASISYVFLSSSGILAMSVPVRFSAFDHVEVAQAEEVHLEEAERLDVLHRELGDDLLVGPLLLERDGSVSGRSPMTTPAA